MPGPRLREGSGFTKQPFSEVPYSTLCGVVLTAMLANSDPPQRRGEKMHLQGQGQIVFSVALLR